MHTIICCIPRCVVLNGPKWSIPNNSNGSFGGAIGLSFPTFRPTRLLNDWQDGQKLTYAATLFSTPFHQYRCITRSNVFFTPWCPPFGESWHSATMSFLRIDGTINKYGRPRRSFRRYHTPRNCMNTGFSLWLTSNVNCRVSGSAFCMISICTGEYPLGSNAPMTQS